MAAGRYIVAEAWDVKALKHKRRGFRVKHEAKQGPCSGHPQTQPGSLSKPCSYSAASTSRQAWSLTRMDIYPLKAKGLPPASALHSRKRTKLPLV